MKVLHVISSIDARAGGPAVALLGLAEAQAAAGLNVSVLSTFQEGDDLSAADRMKAAGIAVELIGPTNGPLMRHQNLGEMCRKVVADADVVHIHALWEQVQHEAARAAQKQDVPYLFRPCGMLDPWSLSQGRLKKKLYLMLRLRRDLNRAAALHFTSGIERDLTEPLLLKPPAIVEPNGVDLAEFQTVPPRGTFRHKHPLLADRLMVLFLSRLHPKKGLELLIPAFAQANVKEAVLVIAGPDSDGYQAKIEALARELGIGDRVIFTGMLRGEERVAALADADLFALPSYQENFGIAVVEALAAGTPVVISDQVNIHREISEAKVGSVVPTKIEPLATELRRWLLDASLRQSAAERARPFVWSHYDWKGIADRWRMHYARLRASATTSKLRVQ